MKDSSYPPSDRQDARKSSGRSSATRRESNTGREEREDTRRRERIAEEYGTSRRSERSHNGSTRRPERTPTGDERRSAYHEDRERKSERGSTYEDRNRASSPPDRRSSRTRKSAAKRRRRSPLLLIIPLVLLIIVIVFVVRACGTPKEKTTYKMELSSQTMVIGQNGHATLVGLPDEKKDSVVWSSSDIAIVSVKGDGELKAEKEGSATIGARVDGTTSSATVMVVKTAPGVTAVTLDQAAVAVVSGGTLQLTATVTMEKDQPVAKVFWVSDDETVARVSDDGLITARDVGETVIKAMSGTQTALCRVSVTESAPKTDAAIPETTPAATPTPETTPTQEKPKTKPAATTPPTQKEPTPEKPAVEKPVTKPAESTGQPAAPVAPTKVTVSSSFGYLSVGETMTLEASVSNNSAVTWGTSDATLATVSGGTVTAKGVGTVTITATSDGQSASCTISITADEEPAQQ